MNINAVSAVSFSGIKNSKKATKNEQKTPVIHNSEPMVKIPLKTFLAMAAIVTSPVILNSCDKEDFLEPEQELVIPSDKNDGTTGMEGDIIASPVSKKLGEAFDILGIKPETDTGIHPVTRSYNPVSGDIEYFSFREDVDPVDNIGFSISYKLDRDKSTPDTLHYERIYAPEYDDGLPPDTTDVKVFLDNSGEAILTKNKDRRTQYQYEDTYKLENEEVLQYDTPSQRYMGKYIQNKHTDTPDDFLFVNSYGTEIEKIDAKLIKAD